MQSVAVGELKAAFPVEIVFRMQPALSGNQSPDESDRLGHSAVARTYSKALPPFLLGYCLLGPRANTSQKPLETTWSALLPLSSHPHPF